MSEMSQPDLFALLPAAPEELAGKTANEPDIVRWVARNIDNPRVTPADCPDPFAWTLLRQCRDPENKGMVVFFIERLWAKLLPPRSQLEDPDHEKVIDGQPMIDMIDRIREISEEAEATSRGEGVGFPVGAHTSGDAGSIPAPATNHFDDFHPGDDR